MTKPTEEQIKALKPGDKVLVEMEFDCLSPYFSDERPRLRVVGQDRSGPVERDAIHSILPREIKVGDRVMDDEGDVWEVVAPPKLHPTAGYEEVGLWGEKYGYGNNRVSVLTVIP